MKFFRFIFWLVVCWTTSDALQCKTGEFSDNENQISLKPPEDATCAGANFCFMEYVNDGIEISYKFGCDESKNCTANGCFSEGLKKVCCCNTDSCVSNDVVNPNEFSFPQSFKFGVATAAYQVEGGFDADGKGPSIWDIYTHKTIPNRIFNNDTGDVACDSYHNYKRDVEMLKELNVSQYRFSISWPRIFPDGTNRVVNQKGVDYYNNLINELLNNGIEPLVTMYHWDLPQYLQDMGGFMDSAIADKFAVYAEFLFQKFGDRVKKWITLNEPLSVVTYGHCGKANAIHAPGEFWELCEWSMYVAAHNLLKCHMKAANIYKTKYQPTQNGEIGITLSGAWYAPKDPTNAADVAAATRSFEFAFGWFAHPIFKGDYSELMKSYIGNNSISLQGRIRSRLPEFTAEEIANLKGSADFLGVNYYIAFESRALTETERKSLFTNFNRNADWGTINGYRESWRLLNSTRPWIVYVPDGLRQVLVQLNADYPNTKMIITENGCMDSLTDTPLNDTERIRYMRGHLIALSRAINENQVNVVGYNAWSLMDNYEWTDGYSTKFGLYNVDFQHPNRTRTAKDSAKFYSQVIRSKKVLGFSPNQSF